jgi:hypothetical protein
MTKRTKDVLNFKYCECGCHGSEAGTMGNSYWIYNDLKGTYTLTAGHGFCSPIIGKYSSYEEAADKATELFKKELDMAKKCLIKVKA